MCVHVFGQADVALLAQRVRAPIMASLLSSARVKHADTLLPAAGSQCGEASIATQACLVGFGLQVGDMAMCAVCVLTRSFAC